MACHFSDTRIDSREVYEDSFAIPCACNEQTACDDCIENGLYESDEEQYNGNITEVR